MRWVRVEGHVVILVVLPNDMIYCQSVDGFWVDGVTDRDNADIISSTQLITTLFFVLSIERSIRTRLHINI